MNSGASMVVFSLRCERWSFEVMDVERALLDALPEPVLIVAGEASIVFVNRAATDLLRADRSRWTGRSVRELVPAGASRHPLLELDGAMRTTSVIARATEVCAVRAAEGEVAVELTIARWRRDGEELLLVCMHDARPRREVEQRLYYASTHDALTGRCNRAYVEEKRAEIERDPRPFAVVIADVDGLKIVNDRYGHEQGDALIMAAADAMSAGAEEGDVVVRLGGDEFALLLLNADETKLERAMDAIRRWVADRAASMQQRGDASPALSLSVGGALRAGDEALAKVMRLADERMYRDKTARRASNSRPPAR
jgi:diguanylate cyclase (GGDEF)-like protein/PAS domain S-box-containing protein